MDSTNIIYHDKSMLRAPAGAPDNKMHWTELVLYEKPNGRVYLRPCGMMHDIEQKCMVRIWLVLIEIPGEGAARLIYSFHAPVLEDYEKESETAFHIGFEAVSTMLAGTQSRKAKALREKYKKKKMH